MILRMSLALLLVGISCQIALSEDQAAAVVSPSRTDVQAAERALLTSSLDDFSGEINFEMQLDYPAVEELGRDATSIVQRWRILTPNGGKWLRGTVTWVESESRSDQVAFGESADALWWTVGRSLCVYHKNGIEKYREGEQARSIASVEQLVAQARSELKTIMAARGIQGATKRATLKNVQRRIQSHDATVELDNDTFEIVLEARIPHWVITSISQTRRSVPLNWSYGDFQCVGDRLVPGWVHYRSDNLTRGGESILYRDIKVKLLDLVDAVANVMNTSGLRPSDLPRDVIVRVDYTQDQVLSTDLSP